MHATFESWDCQHQSVFVRADLNVPLSDSGTILSDFRLLAILPTIDLLLAKKARIILATHIGRPEQCEENLSTKHLIPWFERRGYKIIWCPTIKDAHIAINTHPLTTIFLLENLRFFPEEHESSHAFASDLASLAQWYVLDAFATAHRNDTSLALLATQFDPEHRSIGLLVEKEITSLNQLLLINPKRPLCFIVGGGKVRDKLPLLNTLLDRGVEKILLCPAMVFTFLMALGKPYGISKVETDYISAVKALMQKAYEKGTSFIFPLDYQIASRTIQGQLTYVSADNIPADAIGVSIGRKTCSYFADIIQQSGTVFYNGMMGFPDREETLEGITSILKSMARSKAVSIVAGGESVMLIQKETIKGITYCSTGGGATLAYISGEPLASLQPFLKNGTKTN